MKLGNPVPVHCPRGCHRLWPQTRTETLRFRLLRDRQRSFPRNVQRFPQQYFPTENSAFRCPDRNAAARLLLHHSVLLQSADRPLLRAFLVLRKAWNRKRFTCTQNTAARFPPLGKTSTRPSSTRTLVSAAAFLASYGKARSVHSHFSIRGFYHQLSTRLAKAERGPDLARASLIFGRNRSFCSTSTCPITKSSAPQRSGLRDSFSLRV